MPTPPKPRRDVPKPAAADVIIPPSLDDVPKPAAADVIIPPSLDLDAKRAEREAAAGGASKTKPKVTIGGVEYQLPPDLRLDTVRGIFQLLNGNVDGLDTLLRDLFGPEALELPAFKDLGLADLGELFTFVGDAYGLDLGNSPASTPS